MEIAGWTGSQLFEGLQTLSIVAGLFATAYTFWDSNRTRKIENLFHITNQHRDIWCEVFKKPELKRILDTSVNVSETPPTFEEQKFIQFLINHLASVHEAAKCGMMFTIDGLSADIRAFFSLPIPAAIWKQSRPLQQQDFQRFVDRALDCAANPRLRNF